MLGKKKREEEDRLSCIVRYELVSLLSLGGSFFERKDRIKIYRKESKNNGCKLEKINKVGVK